MATFEFNNTTPTAPATPSNVLGVAENHDARRLKEECIIALKVYDACRKQDCLTDLELGPARSAECTCIDGKHYTEGEIIDPPNNSAAVTIDRLRVKKVIIVDKEPNQFKNGFWDIDLKYVFEYRLTFREADGCPIGSIKANSIYNKSVTLFGSHGIKLLHKGKIQYAIKIRHVYEVFRNNLSNLSITLRCLCGGFYFERINDFYELNWY